MAQLPGPQPLPPRASRPKPSTVAKFADLNLVLAVLKGQDALKSRAEAYVKNVGVPVVVPYSVGIELLFWCRKHGENYLDAMALCVKNFVVEKADPLLTAAHALQNEKLTSPFDAVHLAEAFHAGTSLATADEKLQRKAAGRYPVEPF